jgi:tRNA 2-selenouridine synthase
MRKVDPSELLARLAAGRRWIDVRAPVEFAEGSIPGSVNLPLLEDEERRLVGIEYKEKGQDAAIALGHRLVSGEIKDTRIRAWSEAVAASPDCAIYCFRGGLRSQTVQSWLRERGIDVPIVEGGYKALRQLLLRTIEERAGTLPFQVVCGPTGSGKTGYLRASGRPFLDLEQLAAHRGSAFGAMDEPQPAQIDFENAIAVELLRLPADRGPILIEDESRMIGKRTLPPEIFRIIETAPRLELEVPVETRVENIFRDYVSESRLGRRGDPARFEDFRRAIRAISQRLGDERARELLGDIDACEAAFVASGSLDGNRGWIRKVLDWYYDPVYNRGLERARKREKEKAER